MIDLHCHSTFSDGSFSPEELARMAVEAGVSALALTDHDTMAGLPRFLAAAEGKGFRAVPGVELSVNWTPGGVMHMLGYWMEMENPELVRQLAWIRDGREMRNREILEKLNALGLSMTWEEVKAKAGEDVVGRPHFAQVMLERGYAKDKNEAFDKWLGDGKPGYADRPRLTAEDAVELICRAGGVAVLAHPFTLHLGKEAQEALWNRLAEVGLSGVECYYSEHSSDLTADYLEIARRVGLVPTGGSDFHGEVSPGIRLGTGFGGLNVPDEVLVELEARRPA
ncbi:MAG: PHP domain-containing protein [Verrucomicrobiota bacterium]|jgi:predicted metal-dependent phosphoesterase TrpH|nr:PHP domain-containing protein [Verrucomicrobiota bacterium]